MLIGKINKTVNSLKNQYMNFKAVTKFAKINTLIMYLSKNVTASY